MMFHSQTFHNESMKRAKQRFEERGICVAKWARNNKFNVNTVRALLNGQTGWMRVKKSREITEAMKRDQYLLEDE